MWYWGDFNYDGKVSLADLDLLGQNYGRSVVVPEPGAFGLVMFAGATCLLGRKS